MAEPKVHLVACPYCLAEPGKQCMRFDGSPEPRTHRLRKYAAQLAGLEPRRYIPSDQRRMLEDPEALEGYRAQRKRRYG